MSAIISASSAWDKKGEEWYRFLGGSSENDVALGDILGPSVPKTEVANSWSVCCGST